MLYALLAVITSVVGFVGWQSVSHRRALASIPSHGRFVDVDGRRAHVIEVCSPLRGTQPTVVLEAGLGCPAAIWQHVLTGMQPVAYALAYDRAGHGASDRVPGRRDGMAIARELRALLRAAGAPPPYVLVGHSLGGPYVRIFARLYREDVAGVVLVDATHPDLQERSVALRRAIRSVGRLFETLAWLTPLGIVRASGLLAPFVRGLEGHARTLVAEYFVHPPHVRAARDERRAIEATFAAARTAGDLASRPLRVVTAGDTSESGGPDFATLQQEFLALSSNARQDTVAGATHHSLVTEARFARRVVAAILDCLYNVPPDPSAKAQELLARSRYA